MKAWQLQEAKAKLSELVRQVLYSGPQGISLRGVLEVVLISKSDYEKLTKNKSGFVKFMRNSPLKGVNLNIKRDKSNSRKIEL